MGMYQETKLLTQITQGWMIRDRQNDDLILFFFFCAAVERVNLSNPCTYWYFLIPVEENYLG